MRRTQSPTGGPTASSGVPTTGTTTTGGGPLPETGGPPPPGERTISQNARPSKLRLRRLPGLTSLTSLSVRFPTEPEPPTPPTASGQVPPSQMSLEEELTRSLLSTPLLSLSR